MIELGIGQPAPRVEKHSYTSLHVEAAERWAEHGLYGAAVGAVEISAAMFARAFAGASVEPANVRTAALSPAVLGSIARRLITSGESVHVIDVDGGAVRLAEASSWNVTGTARGPWRYQCTVTGPSETETRWIPGAGVLHCRYATYAGEPWRGIPPLALAGTTGRLAASLERALRDEAGGPVGSLIPLPADAGGESDDPDDAADPFAGLKAQINKLAGRCGLVETTSAGFAEGRAASPQDDWKPRRLGADPPVSLVDLRAAVEETVLSACGVPPGLARAEGGESRESYRRWYAASVQPLAALVQSELRDKLAAPDLRLDFASLAAADVHGRARAWRSLVGREATMSDADARAIVGL